MNLIEQLRALWRARELCRVMVLRELTSRYAGTAAGVLWAYVQPLLTVAAYYVVFDVVFAMRLGDAAPTRAVGAYLIVGMLPWMAFCDALLKGMGSLVEAGGVLQKNALPTVLFPVRTVLASALVHGPILLAMSLLYGSHHHFSVALLALVPLLALLWLVCIFWSYALAIMTAAVRDTAQIVGFLLSIGVFLSPILFPVSMFPANWQWVLWLNPITPLVLGFQSVLLQGVWPPAHTWYAAFAWLTLGAALLELLLRRSSDELVDWL